MFIPIEWLELPIETSWRWTTTCKPQPPTWTRTHSRVWVLGWHSNNSRSRLCFRSVLDGCLPLTPHTVVGFRCLPKLSSCSLPSQPHKQGQPTIKIPSCSKGSSMLQLLQKKHPLFCRASPHIPLGSSSPIPSLILLKNLKNLTGLRPLRTACPLVVRERERSSSRTKTGNLLFPYPGIQCLTQQWVTTSLILWTYSTPKANTHTHTHLK